MTVFLGCNLARVSLKMYLPSYTYEYLYLNSLPIYHNNFRQKIQGGKKNLILENAVGICYT